MRTRTDTTADIWAAFCRNAVVLVSPEKWFDDEQELLLLKDQHPDRHAQVLLWIFARVVNFLALRKQYDERKRKSQWQELWDHLNTWTGLGSALTSAVIDVEASETQSGKTTNLIPFPTIIYSTFSSSKRPHTSKNLSLHHGVFPHTQQS